MFLENRPFTTERRNQHTKNYYKGEAVGDVVPLSGSKNDSSHSLRIGSELPEQGLHPLASAAEVTKKRETLVVVTKRICLQAPNSRFVSLWQIGPMNKSSFRSLAKERIMFTKPKFIITSLEQGPPARVLGDGDVTRYGGTFSTQDPAQSSMAKDPSAK